MSNFNQTNSEIKNVNKDVQRPTFFCKSAFVLGIKNNSIIPSKGKPINVKSSEESNILR